MRLVMSSTLRLVAVAAALLALIACSAVQSYTPNPYYEKYPRDFGGPN
ncbi:hypothetical protein [Ramlibacter tataouinensis]|nr:hypothetical protein [Ramlibacter tataouinensis]